MTARTQFTIYLSIFVASVASYYLTQSYVLFFVALVLFTSFYGAKALLLCHLGDKLLKNGPCKATDLQTAARSEHDRRRTATYPCVTPNTWFHLCDGSELDNNNVVEVRALGKVTKQ